MFKPHGMGLHSGSPHDMPPRTKITPILSAMIAEPGRGMFGVTTCAGSHDVRESGMPDVRESGTLKSMLNFDDILMTRE